MTVGVTESFFGFETGLRARSGDTVCHVLIFRVFRRSVCKLLWEGETITPFHDGWSGQFLGYLHTGIDALWRLQYVLLSRFRGRHVVMT